MGLPCGPILRIFLAPSLAIRRNADGTLVWPDGQPITMEIGNVTYVLKAQ